jgi:uncharacterized protein YjbI with pentapeptide repeats
MSKIEFVSLVELANYLHVETDKAEEYVRKLGMRPQRQRTADSPRRLVLAITRAEADTVGQSWISEWVDHIRKENFRADERHFALLNQGIKSWNQWRENNPKVRPDLRGIPMRGMDLDHADFRNTILDNADFYNANLVEADFSGAQLVWAVFGNATLGSARFVGANLCKTNLMSAHLYRADFTEADLREAKFHGANLHEATLCDLNLAGQCLESTNLKGANLEGANLTGANLRGASLQEANLSGAILRQAYLENAQLIQTNVHGADFANARVYGISVWDLQGTPKRQSDLVISAPDNSHITVDDLEIAQFVYLLLNRAKLRNVIDIMTSRAVLILGRFTPERKAVLDSISDELRRYNLLPIMFDFERSTARDFTETIKTLAGLSLFVIADVTNPKSAPLELQATVPDYQIPFVPIIQKGEKQFSMFSDLKGKYDWVLDLLEYPSAEKLLSVFKRAIIDRAWKKHKQLLERKAQSAKVLSIDRFLEAGARAGASRARRVRSICG